MSSNHKYIFITGGVLSGVGKGITAASIGAVLQAKGIEVSIQKCDPYLNVDAGLLNPREHGECFVTRDGAETDLDLGHYERFLDIELTQANATLSGRLLLNLLQKERAGGFSGKTVQLVPHLTGAIQDTIIEASKNSQVHIVEIGGTVGDYEGLSFIEAIREFSGKVGRRNCIFIHVVYVPFIDTSKEFKTKPAQNALNDLRGFGIVPDVVIVRSDLPAPDEVARKITLFGGVHEDAVLLMPNLDSVFKIPNKIASSPLLNILNDFTDNQTVPNMSKWDDLVAKQNTEPQGEVMIGIVAKYLDNEDTYISVVEALKAAAWHNNVKLKINWLDAETVNESELGACDGILVPGGFGSRGVDGKILAAEYALKHNKPYLGICLGMQTAVIASARRGGLIDAHSAEFKSSAPDVIYLMDGQAGQESTGGTLRLGNYEAILTPGSMVSKLYGKDRVVERHRHRYEVNLNYRKQIEAGGINISGTSPDGKLVEFIEAPHCDYFVAIQAHPEFTSRPHRPHPLFDGLIKASKRQKY